MITAAWLYAALVAFCVLACVALPRLAYALPAACTQPGNYCTTPEITSYFQRISVGAVTSGSVVYATPAINAAETLTVRWLKSR